MIPLLIFNYEDNQWCVKECDVAILNTIINKHKIGDYVFNPYTNNWFIKHRSTSRTDDTGYWCFIKEDEVDKRVQALALIYR